MKYSINHPWKFEKLSLSIFIGALQVMVLLVIEIVTFIVLMESNSSQEIVVNFLTLVIIASLDDFFYKAYQRILPANVIS